MKNYKEMLGGIRFFVFDIDGVFTNGSVTLLPGGEMLRQFNVRDAFAIQLAIEKGFQIAVITGAKSDLLQEKLNALGIQHVYMNVRDKREAFDKFLRTHNIPLSEILIMGDDIPDFEIMKRCDLRTCPADAASEIKAMCQYISLKKGGEGCVRDVIEQVLKAQDKWVQFS